MCRARSNVAPQVWQPSPWLCWTLWLVKKNNQNEKWIQIFSNDSNHFCRNWKQNHFAFMTSFLMVFSTHPGTALVTIHTRPKLLATWSKGTKWPKSWLKLGKGKDIQRCVFFCTNTTDHSGHNSGSVGAWINLMHERWTSFDNLTHVWLIWERLFKPTGNAVTPILRAMWVGYVPGVLSKEGNILNSGHSTMYIPANRVIFGMYFSSCAYVSTESIWESSSSIGRNRSSSSHSSASAMCSCSSGAKFWGPAAFVPKSRPLNVQIKQNLNINTYIKYHVIQIDCMFLRIADRNQGQNLWNPLGKALGSPILT